MRRLYLGALLSITICNALVIIVFAAPPVIDLPLDPDIDVTLTAGFGSSGHHGKGTKAEFGVDIGVAQGTDVIAPFSGTARYQRFANGSFGIKDPKTGAEVPIGGRIPGCTKAKVIRDDERYRQ